MLDLHKLALPAGAAWLAFSAVGYFSGWLVGASQTPVVVTILPLIVGLVGGVAVASFEKRAALQKVLKEAQDLEVAGKIASGAAAQIQGGLQGGADPSYALPTMWSIGIALFCLAGYLGVHKGIEQRVPHYPAIAELVSGTQPTPEELVALFDLRLHLQARHVPPEEVRALFQDTIKPILARERFPKGGEEYSRYSPREAAIMLLVQRLKLPVPSSYEVPIPAPKKEPERIFPPEKG